MIFDEESPYFCNDKIFTIYIQFPLSFFWRNAKRGLILLQVIIKLIILLSYEFQPVEIMI